MLDCCTLGRRGFQIGATVGRKPNAERNSEIIRLRKECGEEIDSIARRFGISHQRVTQIIGYTGKKFRTQRTQAIVDSLPEAELLRTTLNAPLPGHSRNAWNRAIAKHHHAIIGGSASVGQKAERRISEHLATIGLENKLMPLLHQFDILVLRSNARLDVKYCSKPSIRRRAKQWRFNTRALRSHADFYIFVIGDTSDYFVIPSNAIPQKLTRMTFCWPNLRPQSAKWARFHNAFQQLR